MIFFKRFIDYTIFSAAILLAFLLAFEPYLIIPGLVKWIGHWHPLILHFPIVLIFVTIIQYWRKDVHFDWYLSITTLLTLITAITGLLLSLESESKGNLILTHQWSAVMVSYLMTIWYWLNGMRTIRGIYPIFLQGALIILIVITGHFGGMVTHGEHFLAFGPDKDQAHRILPEDPNVFNDIIQPILDEKCISCHNPNKSKGTLLLTDFTSVLKGGESGKTIDHQDLPNSLLLKRITLPIDHEEHMPPKEESQLTDDEMILLTEWIETGGREGLHFSDLKEEGQSYSLVKQLIENNRDIKWSDLPGVSDDKLVDLSSDYVHISRLFSGSDALQVIIYPYKEYNSSIIKKLKGINENIIELNLSGIPLKDGELEIVASFVNLEKLNISDTEVNDQSIQPIAELKKLIELKIHNTGVTDEAFNVLGDLPALSHLFVYNTSMTEDGINHFRNDREDIFIIKTAEGTEDFKSVLPSPGIEPLIYFFREPFKIKLNHPLNGIDLYYTIDGSTPDKTSPIARDSLNITESLQLKFYAAKDGWESSPLDSIRFIRGMNKPDRYALKYPPHSNFAGRGETLLFDLDKGIEVFGDSAWMAYREDNFVLNCEWVEEVMIGSVVVSSIVHTDPYLFPPESITIKGGIDKSGIKVLGRLIPEKLQERSLEYFKFYECQFDPLLVRYVEVIIKPLQRIPVWHQGKDEKGWFFIDEIVFQTE